MKWALSIILIGAFALRGAFGGPEEASGSGTRDKPPTAVLIELFTSEGCSSCPPADRLLSRLASEQPVPGIEVIALGEHVDYWDRLGWPDRFSSAEFTARQRDYGARVFATSTIYTPQLVIDGKFERVGSRERSVLAAIEQAGRAPKAAVNVRADPVRGALVPIIVDIAIDRPLERDGPADVMLAVIEDALATEVERGENRGRTLAHSSVVRRLESAGQIDAGQSAAALTANLPVDDEWRLENVRIVAFVQERGSRAVLGAASTAVARRERSQ
jgi:hypothetical protein